MFNLFKNKTEDINWKWVIKQYKQLGQFRIIQNIDKVYIVEKSVQNFWIEIEKNCRNKDINQCINDIFDRRYCAMLQFKTAKTYIKQTKKAKYIPPKDK